MVVNCSKCKVPFEDNIYYHWMKPKNSTCPSCKSKAIIENRKNEREKTKRKKLNEANRLKRQPI